MSIKSLIQILILILIFSIIAGVYYKYFDINKKIVEETNLQEINNQEQIKELERKISELEYKNSELVENIGSKKTETISTESIQEEVTKENHVIKEKIGDNKISSKEIKNLVKDVEYTSVDDRGNTFYLLANSGKSNMYNNDILDLINVRGKILSEIRDTIYIVSDLGQYNSVTSNSRFYKNVIINYQEKQITCVNFDINMETNKAIAYNDVIITDPKSIMKAGIVEFDLKTKNININPDITSADIEIVTN
tara:strand:+ start:200 stop:952 length:753 start_codon:yes stop_codon:yes gene_type:complete